MKKLLLIAILMLALVFTVVACNNEPVVDDTTADTTAAENPTEAPTAEPTDEPTDEPTAEPTAEPTDEPTAEPTAGPTDEPTAEPTDEPTAEPTDEPTEPETTDLSDPVLMLDPDALNTLAGDAAPNASQLGSNELITEGGRTFVRWTAAGGDPYVAIIPLGSSHTLPNYMAISYRTNSAVEGQFFVGSGAGWTGSGDSFMVTWTEGDWSFVVVDLTQTGVTSITDNLLTYARMDFFAGDSAEGDYFDVQYIGFFNTAEYALAYDFEVNPPYVEVDDAASGKVGHSFDTFYVNGRMYFPEDGGAGDKLTAIDNTITFATGEAHDSMTLRGWIGFSQPMVQFGYYIDSYEFVYGEFKTATEDGVLAAGGSNASRFEILVPLADLTAGTHVVGFVVKLEDETVVHLRADLTVVIEDGAVYPDTSMNVTVNAADNFAADAAVDATVAITNSNLKNIFTTVSHAAGDAGTVINAESGAYYKAQGFSEAFVKMDGTYAYTVHSIISAKKMMASFFIRGAQSVKPADTTGISNPLNNYYETDGQSSGHGGAGIQLWNHKRLFLGVKYYDETAPAKIGTAYWLIEIDCQNKDVQVIDSGSMVYITVDGVLAATVELEGSGKSYDGLTASGGATFCEKATVTIFHALKDDYGFTLDQKGQYVIENTLVVDTPLSDVGIATRTGSLDFSSVSIAPLSTVEIPEIPATHPSFEGNPSHLSVCADNVRTWVGDSYTDLCTQEAHLYMNSVEGTVNADGLDAVSFRGWANPTVGGLEIEAFGYQIGTSEPVFSADFWKDEPELNNALNSPVAKRYENIKIPVADLAAGTYNVYLLVKDTNGVVYCMNGTWGDIRLVKTAD